MLSAFLLKQILNHPVSRIGKAVSTRFPCPEDQEGLEQKRERKANKGHRTQSREWGAAVDTTAVPVLVRTAAQVTIITTTPSTAAPISTPTSGKPSWTPTAPPFGSTFGLPCPTGNL